VDVYLFGINNAMPIATNVPSPITLAIQRRRHHIAIPSSAIEISIGAAAPSAAI
jgi:hypothetical protein